MNVLTAIVVSALVATAGVANAAERYACGKGPGFEVLTKSTKTGWPDTIEVKIAGQPKQVLTIDKDTPERSSWRNDAWEIYSFKLFETLIDRKRNEEYDCK